MLVAKPKIFFGLAILGKKFDWVPVVKKEIGINFPANVLIFLRHFQKLLTECNTQNYPILQEIQNAASPIYKLSM